MCWRTHCQEPREMDKVELSRCEKKPGRRNRLPHPVSKRGGADGFEVLAKLAGLGEERRLAGVTQSMQLRFSRKLESSAHTPGRRVLRSGFLLGFAALGRSLGTLRRLAPAPSQDLVRGKRQNPKHQVGHH